MTDTINLYFHMLFCSLVVVMFCFNLSDIPWKFRTQIFTLFFASSIFVIGYTMYMIRCMGISNGIVLFLFSGIVNRTKADAILKYKTATWWTVSCWTVDSLSQVQWFLRRRFLHLL